MTLNITRFINGIEKDGDHGEYEFGIYLYSLAVNEIAGIEFLDIDLDEEEMYRFTGFINRYHNEIEYTISKRRNLGGVYTIKLPIVTDFLEENIVISF